MGAASNQCLRGCEADLHHALRARSWAGALRCSVGCVSSRRRARLVSLAVSGSGGGGAAAAMLALTGDKNDRNSVFFRFKSEGDALEKVRLLRHWFASCRFACYWMWLRIRAHRGRHELRPS